MLRKVEKRSKSPPPAASPTHCYPANGGAQLAPTGCYSTKHFVVFAGLGLFGALIGVINFVVLKQLQGAHDQLRYDLAASILSIEDSVVSNDTDRVKPRVWIQGKRMEVGYLKHVIEVFDRLGYQRVNGTEEDWDVLWAHDYPFSSSVLTNDLLPHQRVNHFPGSGFITNKVSLATSNLQHVPKAFHLPKDKDDFIHFANEHQDKLWVKKSNDHRGIKIQEVASIDLEASGTFVQEYIQKPFLVDGKKFDIGLYVTLTSINPLRVYIYDSDVLLRFCANTYYPFNATDIDSYVVGDNYTPIWEIPSMRKFFIETNLNMKDTLNAYLNSIGKDSGKVWTQIEETIASVYIEKEDMISKLGTAFDTTRHFFEMVRFDFVMDEELNIYLMEANMSPNLSSLHFAPNKLLYEQVIFNMLSLVGVSQTLSTTNWPDRGSQIWQMMVSNKDLSVFDDLCASDDCHLSCKNEKCRVCFYCLDDYMKTTLKDAALEHLSKWNNKRLIPSLKQTDPQPKGPVNDLQRIWFQGKCLQNICWC